ncbi:hypothetical protein BLNAU_782 [Blattamonas nauphoetae]|uniref:C3H1-type domain-containing protein n=1 Tax=Blattamonas nauphoetae TaxID=2049346 RepID=A0ABQ9YKS0_9EUKA|nr:hypothetical protein BLNAU_782 [Blattamonas nauphoetae]
MDPPRDSQTNVAETEGQPPETQSPSQSPSSHSDYATTPCSKCKTKQSAIFCATCDACFCPNCFTTTHGTDDTHYACLTFDWTGTAVDCDTQHEDHLRFFCITCNVTICLSCPSVLKHRGHRICQSSNPLLYRYPSNIKFSFGNYMRIPESYRSTDYSQYVCQRYLISEGSSMVSMLNQEKENLPRHFSKRRTSFSELFRRIRNILTVIEHKTYAEEISAEREIENTLSQLEATISESVDHLQQTLPPSQLLSQYPQDKDSYMGIPTTTELQTFLSRTPALATSLSNGSLFLNNPTATLPLVGSAVSSVLTGIVSTVNEWGIDVEKSGVGVYPMPTPTEQPPTKGTEEKEAAEEKKEEEKKIKTSYTPRTNKATPPNPTRPRGAATQQSPPSVPPPGLYVSETIDWSLNTPPAPLPSENRISNLTKDLKQRSEQKISQKTKDIVQRREREREQEEQDKKYREGLRGVEQMTLSDDQTLLPTSNQTILSPYALPSLSSLCNLPANFLEVLQRDTEEFNRLEEMERTNYERRSEQSRNDLMERTYQSVSEVKSNIGQTHDSHHQFYSHKDDDTQLFISADHPVITTDSSGLGDLTDQSLHHGNSLDALRQPISDDNMAPPDEPPPDAVPPPLPHREQGDGEWDVVEKRDPAPSTSTLQQFEYTRENPPPPGMRFEGYILGNLSLETKRGWVACRAFPDNVFLSTTRVKKEQADLLEVGAPCDFTVELNVPKSSDFRVNDINIKKKATRTNIGNRTKGICIFYSKTGWCKHGDQCNYAHINA